MNENGNALFLILIAVALFAALSYAITTSGRGGGSIAAEQAQLTASQIMQYAASVKHGVTKLQLINNCTIEQLAFFHSDQESWYQTGYTNAQTPTDHSCQLFHENGAGMTLPIPYPGYETYSTNNDFRYQYTVFTGRGQIHGVGTDYGTDLFMIIGHVSEDLCRAFNKIALNDPTYYQGHIQHVNDRYDGTFVLDGLNDSYAAFGVGVSLPLHGQTEACVQSPDDATIFTIYSVIVAR